MSFLRRLFGPNPDKLDAEALFRRWDETGATDITLDAARNGFWRCRWKEGGEAHEERCRIPRGGDWAYLFGLRVSRLSKRNRSAAKRASVK